jgi:hypothetical protein
MAFRSIPFLMLAICLIVTSNVLAQSNELPLCANTFEIKSIRDASPGNRDGKIELAINAFGKYECELISYKNAQRLKVAQKSASGISILVFDNLDNSNFYKISITFSDESDPMCKTRVIDPITLTGDKRKL